jgi:hypothetical protein
MLQNVNNTDVPQDQTGTSLQDDDMIQTSHVQSNEVCGNISIMADMPDGMTSPEEQNLNIWKWKFLLVHQGMGEGINDGGCGDLKSCFA